MGNTQIGDWFNKRQLHAEQMDDSVAAEPSNGRLSTDLIVLINFLIEQP